MTSGIKGIKVGPLSSEFVNNKGADQPAQSDQRLYFSPIEKYHI